MKKLILMLSFIVLTTNSLSIDKPEIDRLFIMTGQSNMVDMNTYLSFRPTIQSIFPDDNIYVIKAARGNKDITHWDRDNGYLYEAIINNCSRLLDTIDPETITLCLMQGETDAFIETGHLYEDRLKNLIHNLRTDLDRPDMTFVIGRLSDFENKKYTDWDTVRQAQMNVADDDELGCWIDTDEFNDPGNQLHYTDYGGLGGEFAHGSASIIKGISIDSIKEKYPVIEDENPQEDTPSVQEGNCFITSL